jgi:hypothetical protein
MKNYLECYAAYIRDGKIQATNMISTYIPDPKDKKGVGGSPRHLINLLDISVRFLVQRELRAVRSGVS